MFSPPSGGEIAPLALALAWELGVREVYRLGGAVGLAAAAFGTESIAPVDKIVGPGNAFVAEAKRQLFGRVGIDSIAGPSEVLIVADDSADPRWVAADLLAQAEHDPGSAILATPSLALAEQVVAQVEEQLAELERSPAARRSLELYGAVIVTPDLAAACALANELATEHLQIITRSDDDCLARIVRGRHLRGRAHSGSAGRLLCRAVPRAADRGHCALLGTAELQRFSQGIEPDPLHGARSGSRRGRCRRIRPSRGPHGARARGRDPPAKKAVAAPRVGPVVDAELWRNQTPRRRISVLSDNSILCIAQQQASPGRTGRW